jgi:hypothetical protein
MASRFFNNVSIAACVLELAAAAAFVAAGRTMAGLGVLVAAAWIFLNSYFLFRLLEITFDGRSRLKDRILVLSVLKFPVLYLAGYFILKTRLFPASGILTGLTVFMAVFTVQWLRANGTAVRAS